MSRAGHVSATTSGESDRRPVIVRLDGETCEKMRDIVFIAQKARRRGIVDGLPATQQEYIAQAVREYTKSIQSKFAALTASIAITTGIPSPGNPDVTTPSAAD